MNNEFTLYINDLLSAHGRILVKRMFGGHGVYCDGLFIAILSDETLYFKADEVSRQTFENAGCTRFSYSSAGKTATLNFYAAPAEAMESPTFIKPWARLAIEAALRKQSDNQAHPASPKPKRLPVKRSRP
jgi:DNA transformation protein